MTVSELIKTLSELDQDARVVVNGYEGGLYDISGGFNLIHIATNVNTEWYYGPHQEVYCYPDGTPDGTPDGAEAVPAYKLV